MYLITKITTLIRTYFQEETKVDYEAKWYFGGVAATVGSLVTYPFQIMKITMQIRRTYVPMKWVIQQIIGINGLAGFYYGVTSHVLKSATYSFTRFGLYNHFKEAFPLSTYTEKVLAAAIAGAAGGLLGTPSAKINIRMTSDVLLTKQRRNYKNTFDTVLMIYKGEGLIGLFSGSLINTIRGIILGIFEIALYDQLTNEIIRNGEDRDSMVTHFQASLMVGCVSIFITEPLNVVRARTMMHSKEPLWNTIRYTAKYSPYKFYRGFIPSVLHLIPQTIITFMLLEQLRINFGHIKSNNLPKTFEEIK